MLVTYLNKNWFLQSILAFIPILLVIFYIYAYLNDVSRVVRMLTINDSASKYAYDSGVLKEVVNISKKDEKYIIRIDDEDRTVLEYDDIDINLCTNLPKDSIYYDNFEEQFVQNISKDFKKNFILDTNIHVAIITQLLYSLLLYVSHETGKLVILRRKELLITSVCILGFLCLSLSISLFLL